MTYIRVFIQCLFWGLMVVDLVKDPSDLGGLTTSTTQSFSVEDMLMVIRDVPNVLTADTDC